MSFNIRSFESLSARLDSDNPDVIIATTVEIWGRAFDARTAFLLSKSCHRSTHLKGESFRSVGARIGKSHTSVGNYSRAWELAVLVTVGDVPEPETVAHAYTIEANNVSADRKVWYATMPEDVTKRLAWLMESDYRQLMPEPETVTPETPAEPETPETVAAEPESGVAGALANLAGITKRINAGEFTVAEALQLAESAKGIIAAVETLATEAIRETVAA